MANLSRRHYIVVEWRGVKRKLEYVPAKEIRDQVLLLSGALEYIVNHKPVLVLTVRSLAEGSEAFRTVKYGLTLAEFKRLFLWDGKREIQVRFVKPSEVRERRRGIQNEQSTRVGESDARQAEAGTGSSPDESGNGEFDLGNDVLRQRLQDIEGSQSNDGSGSE